jgi:hypothetical protein
MSIRGRATNHTMPPSQPRLTPDAHAGHGDGIRDRPREREQPPNSVTNTEAPAALTLVYGDGPNVSLFLLSKRKNKAS